MSPIRFSNGTESSNNSHSWRSQIWIYVFREKEMRGLSPNFHIHVSVSDLYIPTFGPPIFLQQNRQTDQGKYKSLTEPLI
jgi:hypothetical protein